MESFWNVNDSVYEVGGKDYIFELPEKENVYKKQLDSGYIIDEEYIPNLLKFTLDFINEDEKNQIKLKLSNLKLKLYYKVLKEKITSNLILNKQKLFLPVDECSEKIPVQPIEDEIEFIIGGSYPLIKKGEINLGNAVEYLFNQCLKVPHQGIVVR